MSAASALEETSSILLRRKRKNVCVFTGLFPALRATPSEYRQVAVTAAYWRRNTAAAAAVVVPRLCRISTYERTPPRPPKQIRVRINILRPVEKQRVDEILTPLFRVASGTPCFACCRPDPALHKQEVLNSEEGRPT